jgi:hypothetical protein
MVQASLGGDALDTPSTVRSVLRVEVERLGLELAEGGGRLISQAAMQGVDARVLAYPVAQDIVFAVAKVGHFWLLLACGSGWRSQPEKWQLTRRTTFCSWIAVAHIAVWCLKCILLTSAEWIVVLLAACSLASRLLTGP